jgi:hypothetical protein
MRSWSSGQGHGCLIHVCTSVLELNRFSVTVTLVAPKLEEARRNIMTVNYEGHFAYGSFLGLFATVHAHWQDAQIRSTAATAWQFTGCSLQLFRLLLLKQYHKIILDP